MQNIFERFGPYVFSIILTGCAVFKKINYIDSENLDSALNAILTVASLIIGFLGTLLPVIFSMKTTSAAMKKIFRLNREKRFLEYIESTLILGIAVILISVIMYFRESFATSKLHDWIFYVWALLLLMFLTCTFRVIDILLRILFGKNDIDPGKTNRKKETAAMQEFQSRGNEDGERECGKQPHFT